VNNLNHFVVVEVRVKQLKDGVDHEVMRMKIMNRMKIHPHLQMVDLHGHHVVDKQDEEVVVDQWKIGQNQMINGIIMMIDLVDRKKNFFYLKFFIFLRGKKVHRIVMNQINNVDGDRMQLCLIVILIYDVHKLNEIVRLVFFFCFK
jgi:hypothetical protein